MDTLDTVLGESVIRGGALPDQDQLTSTSLSALLIRIIEVPGHHMTIVQFSCQHPVATARR
jgi:hypothetical protein